MTLPLFLQSVGIVSRGAGAEEGGGTRSRWLFPTKLARRVWSNPGDTANRKAQPSGPRYASDLHLAPSRPPSLFFSITTSVG